MSVYILFMLTLPLLQRLCRRSFLADLTIAHCAIYVPGLAVWACSKMAVPMPGPSVSLMRLYTIYAPVGMTGFLISKHSIFESASLPSWVADAGRPRILMLAICLLCACLALRSVLTELLGMHLCVYAWISLEAIFAVMFVVGFALLCAHGALPAPPVERLLMAFSRHNTNIWFLHALYFTPLLTFQKAAYFPRLPVLVFLVSAMSMLALASLFDWGYDRMAQALLRARD